MTGINHIYEYRGRYYFRMRVPKDLKDYFPGHHIKKSLKTDNLMTASRVARAVLDNLLATFGVIRNSPIPPKAAENLIYEQIDQDFMPFRKPKMAKSDDEGHDFAALEPVGNLKYHHGSPNTKAIMRGN